MFAFPLLNPPAKNRHSRQLRNRSLGFVTLEERTLLTAIDSLPLPPESTDPPVDPPGEIAPTNDSTGDENSDPGIGPTDDTFDGTQLPGGEGGDGGGTDENQAPTLLGFTCTESDGVYQFTGYIVDDADPTGLYVYFDGLISGAYCEVLQGGYFNFEITLEDPSGQVSAVFIDAGSLWSNQETITI